MKKRTFRERISYWFDCVMSKGMIAMVCLLFAITTMIVCLIGIIACFVSEEGGTIYQIWSSLMYTLDAGNLAGVPTDNVIYVFLMTLATICGLFLTTMLIGIISTGVQAKFESLRKGTSTVQEDNHIVIIGFDNNVYEILKELIKANKNRKKACVVVLGKEPKDKMEDEIATHIQAFHGEEKKGRTDEKKWLKLRHVYDARERISTRIICRSGNLHESHSLARCAIESCKSVIINVYDDAETVKILLAISAYLKNKELKNKELKIIASIMDEQFVDAARIAGEGRAEIIFAKNAIARIISNTCRQHGLSQVLKEIFSFDGNELYFEQVSDGGLSGLCGKTFREAIMSLPNAVVVGLYSKSTNSKDDEESENDINRKKDKGNVELNPAMNTEICKNHQLVLLEEDDGAYKCFKNHSGEAEKKNVDEDKICNGVHVSAKGNNNLLILGSNDKLAVILSEYSKYVESGTRVIIVDNDFDEELLKVKGSTEGVFGKVSQSGYNNIKINICRQEFSRDLLEQFIKGEKFNNILLLNDESMESEKSDSQTLLKLILLRDIADKEGVHLSITAEMCSADNQRLASQTRVDDFVIGSNFVGLLMAQFSEKTEMMPLIDELLNEEGSELYMKPVVDYVRVGVPVNSYTLTESAARKGEVYIGYRQPDSGNSKVVINPKKEESVIFGLRDQVVVIARD